MAAFKVVSSPFRNLSAFARHVREVATVFSVIQRPTMCVTQQRSIHGTGERCKGDKFNLSNQSRKKRRFRPEKTQDDTVNSKLQTFQLDPLDDDYNPRHAKSSTRRDALAVTLQQAMTSLLESNDVDHELINYNIDITNVKVAHDKGHVMFYWKIAEKDLKQEQDVETLLKRNENTLRLLLPSYHHLNISPRVVFARDKHVDYLTNIESFLNTLTQESHKDS